MAEKPSEEYPCDSTENTPETPSPSNNTADKNNEDVSGAICTISTSTDLMPEMFYSFDDPPSKVNALQLSMKQIVGKFFDEISDVKYKIDDNVNDNVNVKENNHIDLVDINIDVGENDQNNLIDINIDVNNEPNVVGADGDNHNNMLVTFESNMTFEDTLRHPSFFFDYKNYPELVLLFDNFPQSTPHLPLSLTLTPQLNLEVDFIKQGQEYIDFMSVFTKHDFCKPFLEKIFSYLSYKDIASMTTVSKTWRKAVSKSVNAQKELERVFIHAILYFCHKNANVTDEYKQLYDKILIHFKNQIQFKKNDF